MLNHKLPFLSRFLQLSVMLIVINLASSPYFRPVSIHFVLWLPSHIPTFFLIITSPFIEREVKKFLSSYFLVQANYTLWKTNAQFYFHISLVLSLLLIVTTLCLFIYSARIAPMRLQTRSSWSATSARTLERNRTSASTATCVSHNPTHWKLIGSFIMVGTLLNNIWKSSIINERLVY